MLGYYCKYLKNFIRQAQDKRGFYLDSLCTGLKEVLGEYLNTVATLEQEFDEQVSLLYVQHRLEKYHTLFLPLKTLVDDVTENKVHGCNIFGLVSKYAVTGTPILKEALDRVLFYVQRALVRQSTCWMMRGNLFDPFDEFFIQRETPNKEGDSKDARDSIDSYSLKVELLPSCVPVSLAKKILFTGSAVRVFAQDNPSGQTIYEDAEELSSRCSEMETKRDLTLQEFEDFVEGVRSQAATYLWRIFVEEGSLVSHLQLMRNAFLLGHGDLFQHFIRAADPLLHKRPHADTEYEVNELFQLHCAMLHLEEDADKLALTIRLPQTDSETACGWDCLGLSYSVAYPLHVIFTPGILTKYAHLFRFLLDVRRTQDVLLRCWLQQTKNKVSCDEESMQLAHMSLHMSSLVESLQYYLQVDVVESQFAALVQRVQTTRDFEAIQQAHSCFLGTLLAQTFILLKPLHEHIREVLRLCRSFADLFLLREDFKKLQGVMKALPENGEHTSLAKDSSSLLWKRPFSGEEWDRSLQAFACSQKLQSRNFETERYLLLRILSTLANRHSEMHISQLLLRLDYSNFLSSAQAKQ
ncbi:gamma-tubulin complex component 4-like [Ornithodoros turicata]|uniref:gamma-tubulin complex component 4-like n=1 Tax=Ornithodoros turicata TaxID=34597 RepID=UPI00313A22F8